MAGLNSYEDGERVRLVVSFSANGKRYEAGWMGTIAPFRQTLNESQATDRYEVNFDDAPSGADRGMILLQGAYFERASETRMDGELRQGDRVKLITGFQGEQKFHEAGQAGTVFCTYSQPDRIKHGVALDFLENVIVSREQLAHIPGRHANVFFSDDEGIRIDYSDGNAF
jgi:hypothetical protein